MENLNPDFLDFITLLEKKSVEYLVVGGYAVGFHGFPRYTGDIDFFVAVSEMNARRLMEVFQAWKTSINRRAFISLTATKKSISPVYLGKP